MSRLMMLVWPAHPVRPAHQLSGQVEQVDHLEVVGAVEVLVQVESQDLPAHRGYRGLQVLPEVQEAVAVQVPVELLVHPDHQEQVEALALQAVLAVMAHQGQAVHPGLPVRLVGQVPADPAVAMAPRELQGHQEVQGLQD